MLKDLLRDWGKCYNSGKLTYVAKPITVTHSTGKRKKIITFWSVQQTQTHKSSKNSQTWRMFKEAQRYQFTSWLKHYTKKSGTLQSMALCWLDNDIKSQLYIRRVAVFSLSHPHNQPHVCWTCNATQAVWTSTTQMSPLLRDWKVNVCSFLNECFPGLESNRECTVFVGL